MRKFLRKYFKKRVESKTKIILILIHENKKKIAIFQMFCISQFMLTLFRKRFNIYCRISA
jgi:hypothetical protein